MKVIYISFFDPITKYEFDLLKDYKSRGFEIVLLPLNSIGGRNIVASNEDRLSMLKVSLKEYNEDFLIDSFDLNNENDDFLSILSHINAKYSLADSYLLMAGINNIAYKPLLGGYEFSQGLFSLDFDNMYFDKKEEKMVTDTYNSNVNIFNFGTINVPKSVYDYIISKKIYFVKKLYAMEDLERFKHSVSVANICYKMAEGNHMDVDKAFIAGLLHDCGKDVGNNITSELMHRYFIEDCILLPFCYHQFVGSFLAKKEFGISDEDIVNSIRYHCTGRSYMSNLEKIVYAADKTDPLRGYESKELINLCSKDINKGFIKVLSENIKFLRSSNSDIENKYTKACIEYYLKDETR